MGKVSREGKERASRIGTLRPLNISEAESVVEEGQEDLGILKGRQCEEKYSFRMDGKEDEESLPRFLCNYFPKHRGDVIFSLYAFKFLVDFTVFVPTAYNGQIVRWSAHAFQSTYLCDVLLLP